MRALLFLLAVVLSSYSAFSYSATTYYWVGNAPGNWASADAGCKAWTESIGRIHNGVVFESSGLGAYCKGKNQNGTDAGSNGYFQRRGDSCPAGTTYDSAIGGCKNPCSVKAGSNQKFSKAGTAPDNYMNLVDNTSGKKYGIPRTEGCFNSCEASTSEQKCVTKTSGNYYCQGTAYFTGNTCPTGSTGVDSTTATSLPDAVQINEDKPCVYKTNPDGTQSCTSSKNVEHEGQVCGTVSATGQQICVDKQPDKNGVDISTNVLTTTNPDGTKDTVKTDTATTTKCDGIKTCTTSTTKVTTTIKTDGDGKTTSVTGSCTGANCPDSNTNPDGNGDGFGDCVSGDCGDGEGGGGPNTPELADVDDYQVTTQKFYDKIKSSPVAASVNAISVPENGAAPNFRTDSIAALGGVSLDFGIVGQLWSSVADVLSAVMKAVWCFVAVVIFLMA